jgi:hypothetical protein
MRLARLLVACVAFFVVRPATAATPLDTVVLVAEALGDATDDRGPERVDDVARAPVAHALGPRTTTAADTREPVTGTPLVLVPSKYLRFCALLC